MPIFRTSPFEELIVKATNENNVSEDWSTIMDICDKVVLYEDGQKHCLQIIMKRLNHKVPRVVVQALILLDSCVKNCGKKFHLELSSRCFVTDIQKVLAKMPAPGSDKLKQLLKKWAEHEFKDDPELGLIPSLYYKLKSEGVEFPSEPEPEKPVAPPISSDPDVVSSKQEEEDIIKAITLSLESNTDDNISFRESTSDSSSIHHSVDSEPLKVRALYDFEAVEENELTIKSGEIVLITDKNNASWWKGTNHRGEGFLPSNFVSEDLDAAVISAEIHAVQEEQTLPKQLDDEDDSAPSISVTIDEKHLDDTLNWLNDIDPVEEAQDSAELLEYERKAYAMATLIDEKLQLTDKRCTLLNSLNSELVDAIQLFYELNTFGGFSATSLQRRDPSGHSFPAQQYRTPENSSLHQMGKSNTLPHPGTTASTVPVSHVSPGMPHHGVLNYPYYFPALSSAFQEDPQKLSSFNDHQSVMQQNSGPAKTDQGNVQTTINTSSNNTSSQARNMQNTVVSPSHDVPIVYQPVILPPEEETSNYLGHLPLQPAPIFMYSQPTNPFSGFIGNPSVIASTVGSVSNNPPAPIQVSNASMSPQSLNEIRTTASENSIGNTI